MSRFETVFFVVAVVLGPALIASAVDALSRWFGPKVNESTRLWMIAGLSFLLGLAVARWVDITGNVGALACGAIAAIVIPRLFDRKKVVREWSRLLAFLAVAVLVNSFVQLRPVLSSANGPQSDAVVKNTDVSVFQIIFDEFPLYALLNTDGSINEARFPGFAELAKESTWFRNAVAESNFTHQAVPALLASAVPQQSGGPFLAQYPQNIFTLFAGKTSVGGIEPVTSLCPQSMCGGQSSANGVLSFSRLRGFFRDASYVYTHRVMPPVVKSRVPSIEGAWGGFGAVADKFKEQFNSDALTQIDALNKGVQAFVGDPSQRVQLVHMLMPHAPWRLTPDQRVAPLSPSISTQNPESEDGVRDTYQTFLYQLAATDRALLNAIDDLKQADRWDSTMLVVSADHGISFLPTLPQRHSDFSDMEQSNDIYRVPLFVKFPQQVVGKIDDCAVTNLDVLPTILDVTHTESSWKWAGASFASSCPQRTERRVVSATGETATFDNGFEEILGRVKHYDSVVPHSGDIRRVAAIGSSARLVGSAVLPEWSEKFNATWSLKQKDLFLDVAGTRGSRVPSLITGSVTLESPTEEGTEGLVAIDGVVAGVIGELSAVRDTVDFTAILDYSLLDKGSHQVELYVRTPDGVVKEVGLPN